MSINWTSIIVALCSLLGKAIGSYYEFRLISYRVNQNEKTVSEHNNFARRLPLVEEEIKFLNHRVEDLEHK